MRWRVLALISLGVNLALAVALFWGMHHAPRPGVNRSTAIGSPLPDQARTNVVMRRQFRGHYAVLSRVLEEDRREWSATA